MKRFTFTFLTSALFLTLAACQSIAEPDLLMELNRKGEWQKVRDSGLFHLKSIDELDNVQLCEVYFNLIYSELRLGEVENSRRYLEEFRIALAEINIPSTHLWLEKELKKLEDELES